MKNKKYYKEDIIDAIIDKFGSIDEFAKHVGTSRQNIYGKIERQSRGFLKELKETGLIINEGVNIGETHMKGNKGEINIETHNTTLTNEVEKLKTENEMLKEIIKGKDEIISLLKKNQN